MTFKSQKIFSCILILAFLTSQLQNSYAEQAVRNLFPPLETLPFDVTKIVLPQKLGALSVVKSGTGPVIIHIQEAHGSYEVQKKIKDILQYLQDSYGFKLILLEGDARKLDPKRVQLIPGRSDANDRLLDQLAQKSLVTGPELFAAHSNQAMFYGIEHIPSYVQNNQDLRALLSSANQIALYEKTFNLKLKNLSAVSLNAPLRKFLEQVEDFERGLAMSETWFQTLKKQAQNQLGINFSGVHEQFEWPMLVRLFKLQEFESKIDAQSLAREKAEFLDIFKKRFLELGAQFKKEHPDLYSHLEAMFGQPDLASQALNGNFEVMMKQVIDILPQDFPYQNYPNLNRWIGYFLLKAELQIDELLTEEETLIQKITNTLCVNDLERKIVVLLSDCRLLKRLLDLELTPKDYEEFLKKESENRFQPSKLAKQFASLYLKKDLKKARSAFQDLNTLDHFYEIALRFYQGTHKRDEWMVKNIEARLRETGEERAVVITGGFHSKSLEEHFRKRGYSYALISPAMSSASSANGRTNYLKSKLDLFSEVHPSSSTNRNPDLVLNTFSGLTELNVTSNSTALSELRSAIRSELRETTAKTAWVNRNAQKIAVIGGAGYVGATKSILSVVDFGHDVIGVDVNQTNVDKLNRGELIHDTPKLEELLKEAQATNHLRFTTNLDEAIEDREILFLALPTPQSETGEADTKYLETAVRNIAKLVKSGERRIIVGKSTAPPETIDKLRKIAKENLKAGATIDFAWEPEFLREGSEVDDDRGFVGRLVIGADSDEVAEKVLALYKDFDPGRGRKAVPIIKTDVKTAMLIKYFANAFRALKVSFINYIALLTEFSGLDINAIADAIGEDPRVVRAFISAGLGFGGSCFPKDIAAFMKLLVKYGVPFGMMLDVLAINDYIWQRFVGQIVQDLNGVDGKTIVILGAAFKPKTDDVREARSIKIIEKLVEKGAHIIVVDPSAKALKNLEQEFTGFNTSAITYVQWTSSTSANFDEQAAIFSGAHAIALVTEWEEFKAIKFGELKTGFLGRNLSLPAVFDGRNLFDARIVAKITTHGYPFKNIGVGHSRTNGDTGIALQSVFSDRVQELFLAIRISFINNAALLAEKTGTNIRDIREALVLDPVIGGANYSFAGIGIGGNKLFRGINYVREQAEERIQPHLEAIRVIRKALKKHFGIDSANGHFQKSALTSITQSTVVQRTRVPEVLTHNIVAINEKMIDAYLTKIEQALGGDLKGKKIALLGLAYKLNSYSIENSPSISLIRKLLEKGAILNLTDAEPAAVSNARRLLNGNQSVKYFNEGSAQERAINTIKGTDAQILLTASPEFKNVVDLLFHNDSNGTWVPNPNHVNLVDGRHFYDPKQLQQIAAERKIKIPYYAVGFPNQSPDLRKELRSDFSEVVIKNPDDLPVAFSGAPPALSKKSDVQYLELQSAGIPFAYAIFSPESHTIWTTYYNVSNDNYYKSVLSYLANKMEQVNAQITWSDLSQPGFPNWVQTHKFWTKDGSIPFYYSESADSVFQMVHNLSELVIAGQFKLVYTNDGNRFVKLEALQGNDNGHANPQAGTISYSVSLASPADAAFFYAAKAQHLLSSTVNPEAMSRSIAELKRMNQDSLLTETAKKSLTVPWIRLFSWLMHSSSSHDAAQIFRSLDEIGIPSKFSQEERASIRRVLFSAIPKYVLDERENFRRETNIRQDDYENLESLAKLQVLKDFQVEATTPGSIQEIARNRTVFLNERPDEVAERSRALQTRVGYRPILNLADRVVYFLYFSEDGALDFSPANPKDVLKVLYERNILTHSEDEQLSVSLWRLQERLDNGNDLETFKALNAFSTLMNLGLVDLNDEKWGMLPFNKWREWVASSDDLKRDAGTRALKIFTSRQRNEFRISNEQSTLTLLRVYRAQVLPIVLVHQAANAGRAAIARTIQTLRTQGFFPESGNLRAKLSSTNVWQFFASSSYLKRFLESTSKAHQVIIDHRLSVPSPDSIIPIIPLLIARPELQYQLFLEVDGLDFKNFEAKLNQEVVREFGIQQSEIGNLELTLVGSGNRRTQFSRALSSAPSGALVSPDMALMENQLGYVQNILRIHSKETEALAAVLLAADVLRRDLSISMLAQIHEPQNLNRDLWAALLSELNHLEASKLLNSAA